MTLKVKLKRIKSIFRKTPYKIAEERGERGRPVLRINEKYMDLLKREGKAYKYSKGKPKRKIKDPVVIAAEMRIEEARGKKYGEEEAAEWVKAKQILEQPPETYPGGLPKWNIDIESAFRRIDEIREKRRQE